MRNPGRFHRSIVGGRLLRLEDRINPAPLLPDLHVQSSYLNGWTVTTTPGGGRELRYSTAVANGGAGAFEMRGTDTIITNPDGSQSQLVNQRVYQSDGGFVDQPAGTFTYHPAHGHIHLDDFAWGRLRLRPADQSVGAVVATGPKISFALFDIFRYDGSLPNSPPSAVYVGAGNGVQGISVGWSDIYGSSLEGQSIDITGVPNGDYWLEVTTDPMNHIQETDETNNATRVPITLSSLPPSGFRILSVTPAGVVHDGVGSLTVNFNSAVDAATFTAADVSIAGPAGTVIPTGVVQLSAVQFRIDLPMQTTIGTYTMSVGPNIASSAGSLLDLDNDGTGGEAGDDAFFNVFVIPAPHIDTALPTGVVYVSASTVRLTYNKPMEVASFTLSDIFSFTGPGGVDLQPQITGIVPASAGPTSAIFDITFPAQTNPGSYSMVIEPTVLDAIGHVVDQNVDGTSNSSDRYTVSFSIALVGTFGADAFGYTAAPLAAQDFELIGRPGTFTILNNGDDIAATVNLGTNSFNLYGQTFTGANQLFISTNGLISFGAPNSSDNNDDFSSTVLASIAPMWDDWKTSSVTPILLGCFEDLNGDSTPDRLILQWNQVWHHPGTLSEATFQVALQLNTGATPGAIIFNYPDLVVENSAYDYGAAATVGIRAAGSAGQFIVSYDNGNTPLVRYSPAILLSVPTVVSITRMDGPLIPTGDAEFEVTFSGGVTGVDLADFAVAATGSLAGATIDHIHATADSAVWEVHAKTGTGSGQLKLNLVDNDTIIDLFGGRLGGTGIGNGSFSNGEAYAVNQQPPKVMGVTIGDGTAQKSMIREILVTFDSVVTIAANAFTVVGPAGPVSVNVSTAGSPPSNTVARLTFTGASIVGGSLADGDYMFTVVGSQISTGGVALDGDNNGSPSGNHATNFRRLFGDADGNGAVNGPDNIALHGVYTGSSTIFDYDSDGDVDVIDVIEFRKRFPG